MTPQQMALLGLLCGACGGLGAWGLVAVAWDSGRGKDNRATDLMTRVALSLRDVSPAARDFLAPRSSDPVSVLGVVIQPSVIRVSRTLSQWLGESESAATQLARSGWDMSLEQYRLVRLASSAAVQPRVWWSSLSLRTNRSALRWPGWGFCWEPFSVPPCLTAL